MKFSVRSHLFHLSYFFPASIVCDVYQCAALLLVLFLIIFLVIRYKLPRVCFAGGMVWGKWFEGSGLRWVILKFLGLNSAAWNMQKGG